MTRIDMGVIFIAGVNLAMNVELTAEFERLVQEKVNSGRYNSVSEVVLEALRLLEQRDHLVERRRDAIRKKINEGWDSLQRGEGLDGDAVFAEMERELDDLEKARKAG